MGQRAKAEAHRPAVTSLDLPAAMQAATEGVGLEGLRGPLSGLVTTHFGSLRKTVRKNLVELTLAFLGLTRGGRSGNGRLSLHAMARHLLTEGSAKSRYKRLDRFLDNRYFDPASATEGLVKMALGGRVRRDLLPIITDQTAVGGVQVIHIGTPFRGRVLPLCFHTFETPLSGLKVKSQNELERIAFSDVATSLPPGSVPLFIEDRGYARVALMKERVQAGELFITRGRHEVIVTVGGQTKPLGAMEAPRDAPKRYVHALYHQTEEQPVDIVAYHDQTFEAPWFLVVPPDSGAVLKSEDVVGYYAERMTVEQGFRDWKTHEGVRGLQLKVRRGERLGRLLMAFAIAYALTLALGASEPARELRDRVEILRRTPRHGTRRTLSALTLGCGLMTDTRLMPKAMAMLHDILKQVTSGLGIRSLPSAPQPQ